MKQELCLEVIMKKIVLIYIGFILCGCHFFSDSRSSVEINLDTSLKHQLQNVYIIFGSEKRSKKELNPGESFSAMFFPVSVGSHLDFRFDVKKKRYDWASWESDLFGKDFANKFFKQHHQYEIIIDIKQDNTLFVRAYIKEGLFAKKLLVEGLDQMQHEEILKQD